MSASLSSGSGSGLRLDAAGVAAWRADHQALLTELARHQQAHEAQKARVAQCVKHCSLADHCRSWKEAK